MTLLILIPILLTATQPNQNQPYIIDIQDTDYIAIYECKNDKLKLRMPS